LNGFSSSWADSSGGEAALAHESRESGGGSLEEIPTIERFLRHDLALLEPGAAAV
jgi:hypothetical protein